MRYPGRSRRFDREGDSGAWYGGRPRIGTYLLINLYGPFGAGRINRNAWTWKKRRRATQGSGARRNLPCTRDAPGETEPKDSFESFWGRAEGFECVFYRAF